MAKQGHEQGSAPGVVALSFLAAVGLNAVTEGRVVDVIHSVTDMGGNTPDGLRNVTIKSDLSESRAERLFDCDIQDGDRPTAREIKCAQRIADIVGQNSFDGWSKRDASCLNELWQNESGWNTKADNPTSTAYGIPQALTGLHDTLPSEYDDSTVQQIQWGLWYIDGRYGDPCDANAAWHSRDPHWY